MWRSCHAWRHSPGGDDQKPKKLISLPLLGLTSSAFHQAMPVDLCSLPLSLQGSTPYSTTASCPSFQLAYFGSGALPSASQGLWMDATTSSTCWPELRSDLSNPASSRRSGCLRSRQLHFWNGSQMKLHLLTCSCLWYDCSNPNVKQCLYQIQQHHTWL